MTGFIAERPNFELGWTAFETETNWTQADGLSTVQQAEAASSLAWPFALVYASVEIAFLSFLLLSFAALAQQAPCTADSSAAQFKLSLCGIGGELRRISSPRQKSFCFEILTFLIYEVSTLAIF